MAWLLVQRAVAAGELTALEASAERHRLLRRSVCLEGGGAAEGRLPDGLRNLMGRSHQLYLRIARLEELVAREAA